MWFEIIPSAAIITVATALPIHIGYVVHKLALGNGYRRNMEDRFYRACYTRDRTLNESGNPYIMSGLERIPDEIKEDEEE